MYRARFSYPLPSMTSFLLTVKRYLPPRSLASSSEMRSPVYSMMCSSFVRGTVVMSPSPALVRLIATLRDFACAAVPRLLFFCFTPDVYQVSALYARETACA